MLHRFGAERAARILQELKLDNATKRDVVHLLTFIGAALPQNRRDMRFFLHELGADYFDALCELKRAAGQNGEQELLAAYALYETEQAACLTLAQLAVSGRDLMEAGAVSGRALGAQLQQLLNLVLENPEMNERESLMQYFRENC